MKHVSFRVLYSRNTICVSPTCEVNGLNGLDEVRLFNLEPLQQLSYEARDVQLRRSEAQIQSLGLIS